MVGKPDPDRGQVVKAFVRLDDGVAPSPALARALQEHVKQRLAFAINKLAPEQHELIVSVYFEHQSLREVGERLGRSKSSTSRLHCAALRRKCLEQQTVEHVYVPSAACAAVQPFNRQKTGFWFTRSTGWVKTYCPPGKSRV